MSREKECKCCHEWWYASVIKEDLCPNCYDYFKQLKQQLAEKDKLLKCYQEEEKLIADILGDKDLTIIGSRAHLKNLIVELKNKIKDKDIVIEEKDKEIEKLKTKQKPIVMHSKENYYFLEEENIKLHFAQKQLAIQELEKVKNKCNGMYELWLDSNYKENMYNNEDIAGVFEDISVFTNDLIKKLKGE